MLNPVKIHKVSFKHAYDGVTYTFSTQPNFRFHLAVMCLVVLAGIFFSVSNIEWLVLIFTFNLVIIAEMVNTSIESMVDLITKERREDAKQAKDVSAGLVLVSAIFSIFIGLFIFIPKILIFYK